MTYPSAQRKFTEYTQKTTAEQRISTPIQLSAYVNLQQKMLNLQPIRKHVYRLTQPLARHDLYRAEHTINTENTSY